MVDDDGKPQTHTTKDLREELEALQARRLEVRRRRAQVEARQRRLKRLQAEWWAAGNAADRRLAVLAERHRAVAGDVARADARLQALVQLNAANDCFYIWHAGPFATINGCRLGRLPAYITVEWADINAGLGHVALLLATLVERADFRFRHYQLQPLGSFSKIVKREAASSSTGGDDDEATLGGSASSNTSNKLSLYYDEANLAFFPRRNFNLALTAFLKCVEEFGAYVEKQDPTLRLPHRIQEGQVGGLSIALVPGSEESWTRALKLLLTDLKWLLAWSAKHT